MTGRFLSLPPDRVPEAFARPEGPIDLLFPDDEGNVHPDSLDIDKSWHAIHYLLTGTPWDGEPPLCRAVLGGEPVGEDLGYGPARYLPPDEVKVIADALTEVSPDVLRERYGDGSRLTAADVYPNIWGFCTEFPDYLLPYFTDLVTFYRRAADRGHAMLLFIL